MAVHVEAKRIQLWLNSTKLVVDEVDPELESAASDYVLGRLDALYDISGWADVNTTPRLVQDIISMFMAAWQYRRAYAEVIQGQAQDFPVWLEMRAAHLDVADPRMPVHAAALPIVRGQMVRGLESKRLRQGPGAREVDANLERQTDGCRRRRVRVCARPSRS